MNDRTLQKIVDAGEWKVVAAQFFQGVDGTLNAQLDGRLSEYSCLEELRALVSAYRHWIRKQNRKGAK